VQAEGRIASHLGLGLVDVSLLRTCLSLDSVEPPESEKQGIIKVMTKG